MTNPDPALVERVLKALNVGGVIPQQHIIDAVLAPTIAETLAALRESGRLVEDGSRWQHLKRGTFYTEIGRGRLQFSGFIADEDEVVIYRGDDGKLWVRPVHEFEDGRFVEVQPATAEKEGE